MSKKAAVQLNPWTYQGKTIISIDEFPEGTYGFVYELFSRETGQRYIGKKQLYSYHKKVGKVFNEKTKRWNKVVETTATESNWQKYLGSSTEVADLVKRDGKENFERRILCCCKSKKELTFREVQHQILNSVLENPKYVNSNILGKFFRSDFSEK